MFMNPGYASMLAGSAVSLEHAESSLIEPTPMQKFTNIALAAYIDVFKELYVLVADSDGNSPLKGIIKTHIDFVKQHGINEFIKYHAERIMYHPAREHFWVGALQEDFCKAVIDNPNCFKILVAIHAKRMEAHGPIKGLDQYIADLKAPFMEEHKEKNWVEMLEKELGYIADQYGRNYVINEELDIRLSEAIPGYFRLCKEVERFRLTRLLHNKSEEIQKFNYDPKTVRYLKEAFEDFFSRIEYFGRATRAAFNDCMEKDYE